MSVRLSVCFTGIARTFCLIVVATRAAPGQWSEDFDSYPTGSTIVGQGSWTGWDQTAGIDADVSDDNASSAPNSLRLRTDSDMVHKLQGIQGGVWLLRAKVFIPSDHTGGTWFIVLNKYTAGGPDDWSSTVGFTNGQVVSVGGSNIQASGSLPWITDTWVELEFKIDIDANSQSIFYGGQLLDDLPWQVSGIGEIQSIDLYSGGGSFAYFDDISLAPLPAGRRSVRSIDIAGECPDPNSVLVTIRQPLADGADPGELVNLSETVSGDVGKAGVVPSNGGDVRDIFPAPVTGDGFIGAWLLLGPFTGHAGEETPSCAEMERDFLTDGVVTELGVLPEPGQTIHTDFGGSAASTGIAGPEDLNPGGVPTWNAHYDADDTIDFSTEYYRGDIDEVMMYAFTYVTAATDVDVDLCVASDDGVEVVIDSVEVWCNSVARGVGRAKRCQDMVPFGILGQGEHRVMVKVCEGFGGHGFRFAFKLAGTNDPAPGITACLKPAQVECQLPPVGARIAWSLTREQLSQGVTYTVDIDRGKLGFKGEVEGFRTFGGATALVCPAPTDSQGFITGSQFTALGPFKHRFGCGGPPALLLGNHIANASIREEFPRVGDPIDYDAAAAVSTGYAGPTNPEGKPVWRIFEDGSEDGVQDMDAGLGHLDNVMGWLVTYIEYTGAGPADISVCFGSGDDGQLWWDCDLLLNSSGCQEVSACNDGIVSLRVEPGVHRIAAGAWDHDGGWGLSLRLIGSDGATPIDARSPGWRFLGRNRPDGFTPPECLGCAPTAVTNLTCTSGQCGLDDGLVLSWTNPPGAGVLGPTRILANGAQVASIPSAAERACIPRSVLPAGVYDVTVVRCGGGGTVCSPFKTDSLGAIRDDAWLVVGPFLNGNDGCDGSGDLLANHIAPTRIECFYPAAGEEMPYDPAAPDQGSTGYTGPTGPSGMPIVVPFGDELSDGDLNLDAHYGDRLNVMAWLVTYVEYTGAPARVVVCMGSDESGQVWLNDRMVLSDPACRTRGECDANATVDVEPGVYRIALGIWENLQAWGGRLSLVDPDTQTPIVDDGSSPWRFHGTERPRADKFPGGARPCPGTEAPRFHRGDTDGNGELQLTDGVRIFNVLFLGTSVIPCADAADADDNGKLELTDGVRILNVLFLGTGTIPPPGPTSSPCDSDPTADLLDCAQYDRCG